MKKIISFLVSAVVVVFAAVGCSGSSSGSGSNTSPDLSKYEVLDEYRGAYVVSGKKGMGFITPKGKEFILFPHGTDFELSGTYMRYDTDGKRALILNRGKDGVYCLETGKKLIDGYPKVHTINLSDDIRAWIGHTEDNKVELWINGKKRISKNKNYLKFIWRDEKIYGITSERKEVYLFEHKLE